MNRDMLMAGLEHYSSPRFDPQATAFVYTEEIGPDHPQNRSGRNKGDKLQHLLPWHAVAAAAQARIEALEKAEWFVKLPSDRQWRAVEEARQRAHEHLAALDRVRELNASQAETIRRLQRELDEANQALRV